MELQSGILLGNRWVLGPKISSGAYGTVYSVVDNTSGRKAAVKVEFRVQLNQGKLTWVDPSTLQLPSEINRLRSLEPSPHFCDFLDSGETNSYGWLVMSLGGPSLRALHMQNGRPTLRTALEIFSQGLGALKSLHENGILHRDIKPENFLAGQEGTENVIKVVDFGLSTPYQTANPDGEKRHKRNRGFVGYYQGTPAYTSKNADLFRDTSRKDDLEALVYVIYDLYAGLPWTAPGITSEQARSLKKNCLLRTLADNLKAQPIVEVAEYIDRLSFDGEPAYEWMQKKIAEAVPADEPMDLQWFKLAPQQPPVEANPPATLASTKDDVNYATIGSGHTTAKADGGPMGNSTDTLASMKDDVNCATIGSGHTTAKADGGPMGNSTDTLASMKDDVNCATIGSGHTTAKADGGPMGNSTDTLASMKDDVNCATIGSGHTTAKADGGPMGNSTDTLASMKDDVNCATIGSGHTTAKADGGPMGNSTDTLASMKDDDVNNATISSGLCERRQLIKRKHSEVSGSSSSRQRANLQKRNHPG